MDVNFRSGSNSLDYLDLVDLTTLGRLIIGVGSKMSSVNLTYWRLLL